MSAIPTQDFTKLSALDMLKIDIANTYGLDKELFEDRIKWVDQNFIPRPGGYANRIPKADYIAEASEPLLFEKALDALDKAFTMHPTGHNMFMDATASGIQIMACLARCEISARNCNVIYDGERVDAYTRVTDEMIKRLPNTPLFKDLSKSEIRALVKKPIMTYFYNSVAQPKSVFGENTIELKTFYKVLEDLFPGAVAVMQIINESWNPKALSHDFTMPDGHKVILPVIDKVQTRIEADELSIGQFNYDFYVNQPSKLSTSLAPNIVHAIDGWIVRQMVERADFQIAAIHDAFTCHPNHMTKAMDNYRKILSELSEMNLLQQILSEVESQVLDIKPFNNPDFHKEVLKSQYALS